MRSIASSRGSTPESAKKQVCSTVLVRDAEPGLMGHGGGVDDEELEPLVEDLLLHRAGKVIPDLGRPVGTVEQKGGAGAASPRTSDPL